MILRILVDELHQHAMYPSAAQGYSLIVEDIGVLNYLLSKTAKPDANIKTIIEDWQNLRKARCERIKAWSKDNIEVFSRPPPQVKTSNSGAWQYRSLKDTKPDMNARFGSAAFLKWAQGTDAIEEVGQLSHHHFSLHFADPGFLQAEKYLRVKQSHL